MATKKSGVRGRNAKSHKKLRKGLKLAPTKTLRVGNDTIIGMS
jgi:hypothetical protein